jgi:ABC-type phosphate transport system permease subunit
MKNKEHINLQVVATFKALEALEEVKVNHFFKQKVLQQLNNQKEEKTSILAWFTPSLQLATLALVVLLNTSAVFYAFSLQEQNSVDSLDTFAQEYLLQSQATFLLN